MQANEFKKIRHQFGITQKMFAKLTGIGIASVLRYELGQAEPATTQITMYKMLKVTPSIITTLWAVNGSSLTEAERRKARERLSEFL